DASQKHQKMQAEPPIPAFSNTSQHKGILEEQGPLAFFKADSLTVRFLLRVLQHRQMMVRPRFPRLPFSSCRSLNGQLEAFLTGYEERSLQIERVSIDVEGFRCAPAFFTYRSISPKTMSIEPITATRSASMWPAHMKSVACRKANPGARILQRYGLLVP